MGVWLWALWRQNADGWILGWARNVSNFWVGPEGNSWLNEGFGFVAIKKRFLVIFSVV